METFTLLNGKHVLAKAHHVATLVKVQAVIVTLSA